MKLYLLVLIFSVVLGLVYGEEAVLEVTSGDFDDALKKAGGVMLLEIYSPNCGHCRRLAPTYERVAQNLKGEIVVAKVDGMKHPAMMGRFPIKGFPTIFSIRDGQVREFRGQRTEQSLVEFARSTEGEPLGFFESPFGPVGMVKGFLIQSGSKILEFHGQMQKDYNLGPMQAWGVLAGAGIVAMIFLFAFIMYLFPIPPMPTPPPQRPHQD